VSVAPNTACFEHVSSLVIWIASSAIGWVG